MANAREQWNKAADDGGVGDDDGGSGGGNGGDIVYVHDICTKRIKFIGVKLLLTSVQKCVPFTLHSFKCLFRTLCVCECVQKLLNIEVS